MIMRRQFLLTVVLMPITFGLWYAAGPLFAAPAVWLCDFALGHLYPLAIHKAQLQEANMAAITQFGQVQESIVSAGEAGHQIVLEVNSRLVSYSIAFYAALIAASNLKDAIHKFVVGLFVLWILMAFGLASVLGKDLMLLAGPQFLEQPWVPHADIVALSYQFNVLLMPTLAPVALWVWQLRGSHLWESLATDIKRASGQA